MSTEVVSRQWCQVVVGSISLALSSRSEIDLPEGSNYSGGSKVDIVVKIMLLARSRAQ
jgi:hypothetical protein